MESAVDVIETNIEATVNINESMAVASTELSLASMPTYFDLLCENVQKE